MSTESTQHEPAAEDVDRCERVLYQWVAQDRVPKDIEHVVSVVGEGKRMDERVEVDDAETERDGEEGPGESARSGEVRRQSGDDGRKEEGEGEEGYKRPKVEHLR